MWGIGIREPGLREFNVPLFWESAGGLRRKDDVSG